MKTSLYKRLDTGLTKTVGSFGSFVGLYLLFLIPTYVLPFFGSNSALVGTIGAASGDLIRVPFALHLCALLVLVELARRRGRMIGKAWLIIFPMIAAFFDLMPGINIIPLIPTAMHIGTLVVGSKGPATTTTPIES